LKGFVSQHAEKAIFGLVLGLVGFFIYTSATQEVDETGSPEDLKKNASSARSGLNQDYWDKIRPDREKKVENYADRAGVARKAIADADYRLANIWDKGVIPKRGKRGDPQMLAPEQVVASGGVFNIPMRTSSRDNPWENDKDAVVKPKEETKPKRKRKKRPDRRTMEGGSDGEMLGGGSGSFFMEAGEEGDMPSGYPGGMEMIDPGSSGPTSTTAMTGGRRTIGKNYKEQYVRGHKGTFGQAGQGGALGRSFAVVGVRALVPYEKQWEEYERALAEATQYNPKQDIPTYIYFLAERAEVPADPNAPLDWQPVSNTKFAMQWSARYAGIPKEVADSRYVVPSVLTMPIPPIMLKPYDGLASHKEIPRYQVKSTQLTRREEAPDEDEPIELGPTDLSGDISTIPKVGAGGGGMYPGGSGGMFQPGDIGGGMDPSGYEGGDLMSPEEEDDGSSGMGHGDPMAYEGDGGSGMSGGYGTQYGFAQEQTVVKYKMVRFFDLRAEPGKSYRYRVCVVLEDPNRPRNPGASPSTRILDPVAAKRVREVEAKDEEASQRTGKPTRTFFIKTDWSEPSNIVTIAKPEKYVAGAVTHGKEIPLSENIKVQKSEPHGKLVTMVWDKDRAAEVPVETDVYRGSFLSMSQNADVLHPLTLQIKTVENYKFNTDAFVADLRGGKELITDVEEVDREKTETKHYEPGEFLVIDGEGNLLACDEIDDIEEYRRLMLVEDTDQPGMSSGFGTPGDYGGMEGMEGMEGMDMGSEGMEGMEGMEGAYENG